MNIKSVTVAQAHEPPVTPAVSHRVSQQETMSQRPSGTVLPFHYGIILLISTKTHSRVPLTYIKHLRLTDIIFSGNHY